MGNTAPPKKSLGQHFLVNAGVIDKIVATVAPQPGETLLEIGPGPGALTAALLDAGARVVAVETDRAMLARLRDRFAGHPGLTLVHADILRHDPAHCPSERRLTVAGNIPYNISSPILFWLVDRRDRIARAVLTVQREVARRLTAAPGTAAWGALTVGVRARARVTRCFDIRPGSFRPPPRVMSSTIVLDFPDPPPFAIPDPVRFRDTVRRGFQHRRKMLRGIFPPAMLATAGIDPTRRPETLTIDEWLRVTRHV